MKQWVNFQELRRRLDFAAVLRHYEVEVKQKGDQAIGFCPLPTHDGKRRSPSFSVNLARGIWQCFGCGAKGNVIEFAARMERLNPENPADFRQSALLLQERFGEAGDATKKPKATAKPSASKASTPKNGAEPEQRVIVNTPLDFELKELVAGHPYLAERGLIAETSGHFGLGYCNRGLMAGRIAIPLHDNDGALIGYAGRLVDDAAVDADTPKYKFPGERKRGKIVHEFRKSLFVYNGHAIGGPVNDLVVVEGFPSVWWLWQNGHQNVVGLMGASCSIEQAALVAKMVSPAGRVWLFSDGDDAGERCAADVLAKVAPLRLIRWVKPGEGRQPTDCPPAELAELLGKIP